jgi:hypothetical protein
MKFMADVGIEVTREDGTELTEKDAELLMEKISSYVRYGVHHLADNLPAYKFTTKASSCAKVETLDE